MNPVLYTCVVDGNVPPLPFFSQYLDCVLYIDPAELDPSRDIGPWNVRDPVWKHASDPVRTAKWHKHNPMVCFPHRASSIWMDATHWPTTDISWFPDWFLQDVNIACFPHALRTSIRQEADEIVRLKLDDKVTVRDQLTRYYEAGFAGGADCLLYDTSIVVRKHCPQLKALSELWWNEIATGSRRDQLSFTYCLWKLGMQCGLIVPGHARHPTHPLKRRGSPYFNWKVPNQELAQP
jgi:hypothetical protein